MSHRRLSSLPPSPSLNFWTDLIVSTWKTLLSLRQTDAVPVVSPTLMSFTGTTYIYIYTYYTCVWIGHMNQTDQSSTMVVHHTMYMTFTEPLNNDQIRGLSHLGSYAICHSLTFPICFPVPLFGLQSIKAAKKTLKKRNDQIWVLWVMDSAPESGKGKELVWDSTLTPCSVLYK